ncbi:MAG: DUF1549 domain-containing protein [Verrucomicrobiota bacterium]
MRLIPIQMVLTGAAAVVLPLVCLMPCVAEAAKAKAKGAKNEPRPELKTTLPQSAWHVWSDAKGNTVEAELLNLDGDHVVVRTKEGQSYRLNLTRLVTADREFAEKAERLLPVQEVPVAEAAGKVDALVQKGLKAAGQTLNPRLAEELWVRRLYLDVAGRIPTAAELISYASDKAPDKRSKLIDSLLNSDGYKSQLYDWFSDMLRLKDDYGKGVKSFVYQEWLKDQIAANRHWDSIVYELMTAEGRISDNGPVGYLLRDRGMPLDNLSNTLTTFLGANVACAQCHDHPLANWTERNFYEMAAFFGATEQGFGKGGLGKVIGDKKLGIALGAPNGARVETLPKVTTTFPKDYKYDDAKPGQPVQPRLITWNKDDEKSPAYLGAQTNKPEELRERFAVWLTHPDNPRFAAAIANRVWKKLFGLAVQEPITDLDDPKLAFNPELLAYLTAEMKRVHFDLREFQRILLNTAAYQAKASVSPNLEAGPYLFPGPVLRRMSGEQAWDSLLTLAVGPEVDQYKLHRADEVRKLDLGSNHPTDAAVLAKVAELKGGAGKKGRGKVAKASEEEEFEGNPPPKLEGLTLARASELPQPTKESHFLRNFGQSDRQIADTNSTEGGVPQVLMVMNGDVQKVITSPSSLVLKMANQLPSKDEQIRHMYLSFLGRLPSAADMTSVRRMLEKELTIKDLAWVFLNTREFIFIQ